MKPGLAVIPATEEILTIDPIEVARLALYLACDDSSYSTGSEFVVDGGFMP